MCDPKVLAEISGLEPSLVSHYLKGSSHEDQNAIVEELFTLKGYSDTLGKEEVASVVAANANKKDHPKIISILAAKAETKGKVATLSEFSGVERDIVEPFLIGASENQEEIAAELLEIRSYIQLLGRKDVFTTVSTLASQNKHASIIPELRRMKETRPAAARSHSRQSSSSEPNTKEKNSGWPLGWLFSGKKSKSEGKSAKDPAANYHKGESHPQQVRSSSKDRQNPVATATSLSTSTEPEFTLSAKHESQCEKSKKSGDKHFSKVEEAKAPHQHEEKSGTTDPLLQMEQELNSAYNFQHASTAHGEAPPVVVEVSVPDYNFHDARPRVRPSEADNEVELRNDMRRYNFDYSESNANGQIQTDSEDFQKVFREFLKSSE